jgi:putative ABC transport system permease protein
MSWLRRAWNVVRPAKLDRDLQEELEFHRELRSRRLRDRGLSVADAERETRRRMGNLSIAKEEMRDARVVPWLASSLQDLRHGVVLLRRDAGLSALIVMVLALGIGGNAAIFTLFQAAFLDPLPYLDSGRLVTITDSFGKLSTLGKLGVDGIGPTIPEYLDLRRQSRLLEEAAFLDHRDFQLTGADEPVRVFAARVTASFFPLLGVQAARGRTFQADENQPANSHVVLVSDAFWRGRMGADPHAVGRVLRLNGDPSTVVGVLPPGFAFDYPSLGIPERVEIYVPFVMSDYYTLRSGEFSNVRRVIALGRLRSKTSVERANGELAAFADGLKREYPALYRGRQREDLGFSMGVKPLRDAIVGNQRQLLILLLGAVAVLLLIACANTAQLLLARSLRRGREVAIRAALGAGRARLVRQFLLEGLVLALCGGAIGLVLAGWMARVLVGLLPVRAPIFDQAHPDVRVLGFTLGLSMMTAMLFAIVPAVKGSLYSVGAVLGARAAAGQGNRWRHAMIAVEAALSVFLLSGAGLLGQNLWKLVSTPAGFDADHVAVMRLRLPFRREQATHPIASVAYQEYLQKVAAIPGVDSAATVTGLPVRGAAQRGFLLEGDPDEPAALTRQIALYQIVSPDYFRVLRIPLLAGRTFRDDDIVGHPAVAIVNQEFARRFGNGRDVIGRRIGPGPPLTIVGVVGDVRMSALDTAAQPQIYASYLQFYEPNICLAVRSAMPLSQLTGHVKEAIRSAYADQAVFEILTMRQVLANSVAEPRFHAYLIAAFALLALAMAASGMYSVIACLVSQRTGEIAIRLALGAERGAIVRTVVGRTAVWLAAGLTGGLGMGIALSGTVRRLSHSAAVGSPAMYAAMAALFALVTLIAVYAPVRRAAGLDPARALRCE